jgi:hypothetical protein
MRQTRSCADKTIVLDVGVERSKSEYVRSAYPSVRGQFCSKNTRMPTDMAKQRCTFLQLLFNNASKREISEEVLIACRHSVKLCLMLQRNNYSNYCSKRRYTRQSGAVSGVDGRGRHVPYYDSDFTKHTTINIKNKKNLSIDTVHT